METELILTENGARVRTVTETPVTGNKLSEALSFLAKKNPVCIRLRKDTVLASHEEETIFVKILTEGIQVRSGAEPVKDSKSDTFYIAPTWGRSGAVLEEPLVWKPMEPYTLMFVAQRNNLYLMLLHKGTGQLLRPPLTNVHTNGECCLGKREPDQTYPLDGFDALLTNYKNGFHNRDLHTDACGVYVRWDPQTLECIHPEDYSLCTPIALGAIQEHLEAAFRVFELGFGGDK